MKKFFLSIFTLFLVFGSFSQCVTVNSAYFTNPSGDGITFSLNINWTAEGTNHLVAYVMSNSDTIYTTCVQVSGIGSGTSIYNGIISPGGLPTLSASFCRWTGPCNSGSKCGPDQFIPAGGILAIKLEKITARKIDNRLTEVTFKVATGFSKNSKASINLRMKSGIIKRYQIQIPQDSKAGDYWRVTINHIDGTYQIIKL